VCVCVSVILASVHYSGRDITFIAPCGAIGCQNKQAERKFLAIRRDNGAGHKLLRSAPEALQLAPGANECFYFWYILVLILSLK